MTETGPIRFGCPRCGKGLMVKPHHAGRRFSCPGCNASITAPLATGRPEALVAAASNRTPPPWKEGASTFDPYRKWLGIAPQDQPPHHYRLLGVDVFESDPDTIANAADARMMHVKTFEGGEYSELSQRMLNEIAAAKVCLLNPAEKAEYDRALRRRLKPEEQTGHAVIPLRPQEKKTQRAPPRRVEPVATFKALEEPADQEAQLVPEAVSCPHCNQPVLRDAALAGQAVQCPSCRALFQMPADRPGPFPVPAKPIAPAVAALQLPSPQQYLSPFGPQRFAQQPTAQPQYSQPQYVQPTQIIIQNQMRTIVERAPAKSPLVAFLLAFFFGPLGMLYSTVAGGLVMLFVNVILFVPTAGLIVLLTWPIGCIWAAVAAQQDSCSPPAPRRHRY